ncbi:hypothetical protein P7C73_g2268, partial [Tremellales sp. Uapishka_1]
MPKIVHIVLWKLKRPSILTSTSTEEVLLQAKAAIDALKKVPGPETVGLFVSARLVSHSCAIQLTLGPPLLDARAKGFDWGLYSVFSSAEALQEYAVSKAHMDVVINNVRPNVDDTLAYDFEI